MYELDLDNFQNAVVVDAAALSDLFYSYRRSISRSQLLDLFNLIDQIVLRDRMIVTGGARLLGAGVEDELDLWVREGALFLPKNRVKPASLNPKKFTRPTNKASQTQWTRTVRSAGRLAASESEWKIPGMPLSAQKQLYDELIAIDLEKYAQLDLVKKFRRTSGDVIGQTTDISSYHPMHVAVQLPPLAFTVFNKIDKIHQVHEATLDLRHTFRDLRMRLRELVQLLRDPAINDAKKRCEAKKWKGAWKRVSDANLTQKYSFKVTTPIFAKSILSAIGLTSGTPLDATSIINFGSLAIESGLASYLGTSKPLIMRPVYTTLEEYVSFNQSQRNAIINRVVGRQLETWKVRNEIRSRFG